MSKNWELYLQGPAVGNKKSRGSGIYEIIWGLISLWAEIQGFIWSGTRSVLSEPLIFHIIQRRRVIEYILLPWPLQNLVQCNHIRKSLVYGVMGSYHFKSGQWRPFMSTQHLTSDSPENRLNSVNTDNLPGLYMNIFYIIQGDFRILRRLAASVKSTTVRINDVEIF